MIETTVDGRYQIVARIAAGGMGEVFRAHDPVLDREVALKILHRSLADDPAFIDRFRREARSAATLSHPNIVNVHDWGQTAGTYFMVMEFIRGPNLRSLLMRDGALQPALAVDVATDVLAALGHAHAQGIVHRDIKPENVMIRASDGAVKVADFGLARAFADSRVSQAPGTVTGTVQYLAPEQIEGMPADPRTDLYAVGIVLYELLTGQVPFTGETSVAIAWRHLRERVPPPSRANPMVPVDLDRVVLNATERDRDRRTPDAAAMRTDLSRAAASLPPAQALAEVASSVTPTDEVPADRLSTVTIQRPITPRQRRRQRFVRGFRILSLLALLAVAGWAVWEFVVPHPTTVPNLVGDTLREAQRDAEAAGMEFVVAQERHDPEVEAGHVISQDLAAGSEAEEGDAISVVMSQGPEFVEIPRVVNLTQEAAQRELRAARLDWRLTREYHQTVPEGRIIRQNPEAGRELEVGERVTLTISRGPEPVDLPSVVGQTEQQARDILQNANLEVAVTRKFAIEPAGQVIGQNPVAGTTVEQQSTVTLVVSKGPQQFEMPDVRLMSEDAARSELQGLGLVVETQVVPGNESADTVVGQLPKAGTIVKTGDTVTLFLGDG
ncbi:MAG: Stk1 family PASTA domain-containing Ser/Thr kinase [Actinomycetota bacterium]|nr:Stk1 family PASTA domain-containing Ser/Thr kinase [Actinomycetota bacterium]